MCYFYASGGKESQLSWALLSKEYQSLDVWAMESLKPSSAQLLINERTSNYKLQAVRKQLVHVTQFIEFPFLISLSDDQHQYLLEAWRAVKMIKHGIKRMGELDPKAFANACNQTLSEEDDVVSALLWSNGKAEISNSGWNPFRVVTFDGEDRVQEFTNVAFFFYLIIHRIKPWNYVQEILS